MNAPHTANPTLRVLGTGVVKPAVPVNTAALSVAVAAASTSPAVLARLTALRALLKTMGITDLSSLGTLTIGNSNSPENVLVQGGLTTPTPPSTGVVTQPVTVSFTGARQLSRLADGSIQVRSLAGTATPLPAVKLSQFQRNSPPLSIYDAIWVATTINLLDGTNVILQPPGASNLLIIAENIVIGNGVTFTWQQQPASWQPATPDTPTGIAPSAPSAPAVQTTGGATGSNGTAGSPLAALNGGNGAAGSPGPDVEIWTLSMTGVLNLDLTGQDGQPGGRGQDGQPGGVGGQGGPSDTGGVLGMGCSYGPGSGGTGGAGGSGGQGGSGGNGGNGGQFALFAPVALQATYVGAGLILDTQGGAPGAAGLGGAGGPGGAGGALGVWADSFCQTVGKGTHHSTGSPGATGSQGNARNAGSPGSAGTPQTAALFNSITPQDFNTELTAPQIASLSASFGSVGDSISLVGGNIEPTDVVMVDNVAAATTISSNTTAAFTVPDVEGGQTQIVIQRADGEVSNPASFTVLPKITSVSSDREKRGALVWGSNATIVGSGFSSACRVQINGADTGSTFVNQHTLTLPFTRPGGDPLVSAGATDPFASSATVEVLLPTILPVGATANTVTVPVAICRIAAIGDSVVWGQGLSLAPPSMKFVDLVRDAISAHLGDIDTFVDMKAHSGAVLGPSGGTPAASGEIPDAVPTIPAQVAAITSPLDIDVVIVDGGINDVGVGTILNPTTSTATLTAATTAACGTAMTSLLSTIIKTCPNAQIVVTSYFPILSPSSNLLLIELLVAPILNFFFPGIGLLFESGEINSILSNCATFFSTSSAALAGAVAAANAAARSSPAPAGLLLSPGAPRVVFAAPPFTNDNAALAPSAWLFGINANGSPQDPVAASRAAACAVAFPGGGTAQVFCDDASVGHPNQLGAIQFSQAIENALFGTACVFSCSGGTFNSTLTGVATLPAFSGPLIVNEVDGLLIIPTPWIVPKFGALTGPATLNQNGLATFSPGPLRGSTQVLTIPATISGSVSVGSVSGSGGLTTGTPPTAGGLPAVTGAGLKPNGTITLVMAGTLSAPLGQSVPFTLSLPGTLAPIPA